MPKSKLKDNTENTENKDSWWYSISASYGKFMAIGSFIFTVILFIIAIIVVNYFFYNKEDLYGEKIIKGKIKDSTCNRYITNSGDNKNSSTVNYDCNMNISYNIDNIEYEKKNFVINSTTYYNKDSMIDLRYNKNNPNDITEKTLSYDSLGNIILLIFFIIMFLSGINLIVVLMFKPAAAASGIASLGGTVASGISRGWRTD